MCCSERREEKEVGSTPEAVGVLELMYDITMDALGDPNVHIRTVAAQVHVMDVSTEPGLMIVEQEEGENQAEEEGDVDSIAHTTLVVGVEGSR